MILVLAVVAGYGIYHVVNSSASHSANNAAASNIDHSLGSHHRSHPTRAAATPTPSTSVTPNQNVVISLTAIQDCWVEFTKPDGRFLTQAYIVGGAVPSTWTFDRSVNMDIGNPGGIVLTVKREETGLARFGRAAGHAFVLGHSSVATG